MRRFNIFHFLETLVISRLGSHMRFPLRLFQLLQHLIATAIVVF